MREFIAANKQFHAKIKLRQLRFEMVSSGELQIEFVFLDTR